MTQSVETMRMPMSVNRCYFGDCRRQMQSMIDAGVEAQMCVTSPPYWGMRDYGVDGQIGLEETLAEYIDRIVDSFRAPGRRLDSSIGHQWQCALRRGRDTVYPGIHVKQETIDDP